MHERTMLFGLELVGVGTPAVESLRSFIQRLAFAHSFKPRRMMELLFERYPLQSGILDLVTLLKFWGVHCAGEMAIAARERLELATGVGLKPATFAQFCELVSQQHLAELGVGRYCPECVTQDNAYGQLLWAVDCVKACPVHGVRLRDASVCGAPPEEHLASTARPRLSHVCSSCGSIGFKCVTEAPEPATPEEVWVAQQVGRLLAVQLGQGEAWTPEQLRQGLSRLVQGAFNDSVVGASQAAGLARGTVCMWRKGTVNPSFSGLMQLCHAARADVVELFRGRCVLLPAEGVSTGDCVKLLERQYVRTKSTMADIRLALEAAPAEVPPPNLRQLAERLGTNDKLLSRKFPELARAVSEAAAQHRDEQYRLDFDDTVRTYQRGAQALVDRGRPVHEKSLQQESGLVAFSRNPSRRLAMQTVLEEFADTSPPLYRRAPQGSMSART